MAVSQMCGVYPIVVTPFDHRDRVDVDSLQSLVDFLLDAGVHGLGVALGSEVLRLTESERSLVTRTVVERAGGRVPVVINSSGTATVQALHYSRLALDNGADALMLTAPSQMQPGPGAVKGYYSAIAEAIGLPVFIQDVNGQHVSAQLALEIAEASAWVQYIKVESSPITLRVAEAVEAGSDRLTVFGGGGGNYLIEELRRGSQGTMPGCSTPAAFVRIWDLFQAGDEDAAQRVFYDEILPVNRLCGQGWGAFYDVHKRLLQMRGVISSARVRDPSPQLDAATAHDLAVVAERLYGV